MIMLSLCLFLIRNRFAVLGLVSDMMLVLTVSMVVLVLGVVVWRWEIGLRDIDAVGGEDLEEVQDVG